MKFPLLVLFATGALSAPFFDKTSFNAYFFEDDCSDPRLRDDSTSIYSYEGETVNTVQGSTPDSTGLKLRATIYIHPLGACKYRMQINNPELLVKSKNEEFQTAPESRKLLRELQAQDLVFQTSKGRINKLYPAAGESIHVLNIKRGILSTLQLQKDATEEIDVNGKCKVEIVEKNGVVIKTKDLAECSDRALNELGLQTATFAHSKMPVKPLNSKSICEYITQEEKIVAVECRENHLFRPFSAGYKRPAGAMTTVKQTLKLQSTKGRAGFAVETKELPKPVTLIFGHEKAAIKPDNSIISRIDAVMDALVKKGSLTVKQNSAHEFVELVNLVRKLDSKRMESVMGKYFNFATSNADLKGVYKQFFLDALTYCGTPTCVTTVHDVIVSGDVTGEYRNMFLQGISLVAKPTKQMIRDVLNIAKSKPSRQAFLSLGILINRYCKLDAANCVYGKTNPVSLAEFFLEAKLGEGCDGQDNHERVEEMLMAIKAIGNAGQPTRAIETLVKCAKTSEHMNITTAALEALRRMPCNEKVQSVLHDMYEDLNNVDAEKRIQTYLALINCPSENTLKRIVQQLEAEQSNQVGSFVSSHLKNIQESSDPKNARTVELLAKIIKGKELKSFDLPFTKFSKAWEGSVYSKYLKSGATVNGHLIYNPESFVPRSSLISMSANILDVPVDVFEMAARIEGVESIVEDFFGPYGYFPDDTIMKIFNVNIKKEDLERMRSRRSVDEGYENTIKEMHENVNKKKQPSGFLSMKVLGHEMRVFSFDDFKWAADEIDNMNVIELLLKVAKGGHKTFTKSIMFLEMTHTVPTGVGLPLKLQLTGSAVGSLELDGKFDIRNMFWGPMSLEIKGSVKPSTVVEVSGQMGISSHYIDTGIFVNSSMYTSQVVKGSVLYREGQQLKINVDAPEKPIEFFNISSTPYTFVNEDKKLIDGTPRRLSPDFCLNSKMVLGLGLCTRLSVPVAFRDYEAPYFPLSGPASFGMKLVKADPKLTTYQFLVSLAKKRISAGSELIGTFEVGTPGATYSRGLSGSINYKETTNLRELTIGSSEKDRSAQLKITYHNNTNRLEVNFDTNVVTPKPINVRFLYFNDTSYMAKEMGILASASCDWYTFQHVTKFVKKMAPSKSYLMHTRTTYWPRKHLTGEIEYSPVKEKLSLRFASNQFNQRTEIDGTYISTETEKGFDFTATHNSKRRISFYTGIMNTEAANKLIFNVKTVTSKPVELILGYYLTGKKHEIRFDADVFGKSGKIFVDYSNLRSGWHGMNMGAKFQEQTAGVVASYNNEDTYNKEACIVTYMNEKRPAKTCLSLKGNQLTWSVEVLKKTAAVSFGLTKSGDSLSLDSILTVQEQEILKNAMELTYKNLFENEIKTTMSSGKYSVMSRLFSTSENDEVTFGVEGKGFGKFVKLQAKYSKVSQDGVTVRGVIFEGWMNKKLPASYTFLVETSAKMNGVKTIFKVFDYSAKASFVCAVPKDSQYVCVTDVALQKKEFVMFGSKSTEVMIWADSTKGYKLNWELTLWNKKFNYGFDVELENKSTGTKSEYALTVGTNFARNKRSSLTATLANSESATQLFIDVNYLPGRALQHMFKFDKQMKKLDISVEFLPKMFVRLAGQVNKLDGWQFTTNMKLSWANYERTIQTIAAYIDKTDFKGLNFEFSSLNQKLAVGSEYDMKSKTLRLFTTAFGRSAQVLATFDRTLGVARVSMGLQTKDGNALVMKELFETVLKFSQNEFSLEMNVGKTSLLKTVGTIGKTSGSFEVVVLKTSIGKALVSYNAEEKRAVMDIYILGKQRLQTISRYNQAQQTALLSFNFLRKGMNIVFSGRWNSDLKQITISTEVMGRRFGLIARFDPINYAAGFHIFYQKSMVGWSALYNKESSALVYNVKLASKLTIQVLLQMIDDRIITMAIQRKTNGKFVNEVTMKYELSSSVSRFMFEWNKDTVKQVKDIVVPIAKQTMKSVTVLIAKTKNLAQSISTLSLQKFGADIMTMIRSMEQKFDEFDFSAYYESWQVSKYVPMMMEKGQRLSRKVLEISKTSVENGRKIVKVVYKSLKELADSGVPVAKLALKMAKEFKFRGKTTEEIVMNLVEMGQKIIQSYKENMAKQIKTMTADVKNYLLNVVLPFTDKKVSELVDYYMAKLKSINFEKKAKEITKMILEYEVMGRQMNYYLAKAMATVNNLPDELKMATLRLIQSGRSQVKNIMKITKQMKSYFTPMTRFMTKVVSSVKKHFGPLVEEASMKVKMMLRSEFIRLYTPLKAVITDLWRLLKEFALPLVKPIRPLYEDIKQQVRAIQLLEKEIGELYDEYVKELTKKISMTYSAAYMDITKAVEEYMKSAKETTSMTLEEIAVKVIDETAAATKKIADYLKAKYSNRKVIVATLRRRIMKIRDLISEAISIATSRPVNEMMKTSLQYAGKYSMAVIKETSKLLDQIWKMDVATPLKQAWNDMDLLNHLAKYGLRVRLTDVIESAKKIDIANSILKLVKITEKIILDAYSKLSDRVSDLQSIVKYVKSIPQKDFETWYSEVVGVVTKSQDLVAKAYTESKIYYRMFAARAVELSKNINELYVKPAKNVYGVLKGRAGLVYDDIKDDSAIVYEIYSGLVYGAAKENYEKVKRAMEIQYKKLYDDVVAFYKKYEDKTWEEIGTNVYSSGKQRYEVAYAIAKQKYEKAVELVMKAVAVTSEMKDQVQTFVSNDGRKWFEMRAKPAAIKLYKKIITFTVKLYKEVSRRSSDAYMRIVFSAFKVYENNKDLSIRQLVRKGRSMVAQMAKERYQQADAYARKLKAIFVKDVLPVLKEESVSIINQCLKNAVILAEETVKAFKPQFVELKNQIYSTKLAAMKAYESLKETSIQMYKKGIAAYDVQVKIIIAKVNEFVKEIKENQKYQELLKTEAFIKIEKMLKTLAQMVNEKIEELKVKVEELKKHPKVAEMKKQLMMLKDHETVKYMIAALYDGKDSLMFSLRKMQTMMKPQWKRLMTQIDSIPELAMAKVSCFRQDPVECFWTDVQIVKNAINRVVKYNLKELATKVTKAMKGFLKDVTDERTKEMYSKLVMKGTKVYEKLVKLIQTLPSGLKSECTKICNEQMKMLREQYAKIVAKWKTSPFYQIFANEIWTEIADEVMKHEIVVELRKLAKLGLEKVATIYARGSKNLKEYVTESRKLIMARYNGMITKFNDFVDETTLEDIVLKALELRKKVTKKVDEIVQVYYSQAIVYKNKVTTYSRKYYDTVKRYVEIEYPKVMLQMKKIYAQYLTVTDSYLKSIMEKSVELGNGIKSRAVKTWLESSLKKAVDKRMKMTVGETVANLMKMPGNAKKMYQDMAEMVVARYHLYVQPYVKKVLGSAKFVGNEINETIVFLVRYYNIKDSAKQIYVQGYEKIASLLPKIPVIVKSYACKAGKISLKAVHSTLVYVDKIDLRSEKLRATLEKIRGFIPDVKKYVSVEVNDHGIVLSFVHPKEITPSFKHHVANTKSTIKTFSDKIKTRTDAVSKAVVEQLKARTMELRNDLNKSFVAHAKLGKHSQSLISKTAVEKHASMKKIVKEIVDLLEISITSVAEETKKTSKNVYKFGASAALAIMDSKSIPEAYEKMVSYSKEAIKKVRLHVDPYTKGVKVVAAAMKRKMMRTYEEMWSTVKPYYVTFRGAGGYAAYVEVKRDLMVAYKGAIKKLQVVAVRTQNTIIRFFSPKYREALQEYSDVHIGIMQKYGKRLFRLYKWNKVMLDRTIRRSKMSFFYKFFNPLKRRMDPFRTYAMIFGKRHVMTFDGKYYEFPKHPKPSCTYLLARDFRNGNFTILVQSEKIIVETPELKVSIDKAGAVKGAIKITKAGITVTEPIKGLPIEMKGAICKRYSHYVKCEFKQGIVLRCDVKHFLCTVELSGWHFGKSQGLLGTNNREIYDEFKMVNKKTTNSLEQFANSWLVTRTSDCYIKESNNESPQCYRAPSQRCIELFKSSSSPLAKYFSDVDPLSFLKACQIDTAHCNDPISHCDSVAAYRAILSMRGIYAKRVQDCGRKNVGKTFTVKQGKAVDIVVLMSSRKQALDSKKIVASMLYNTNKKLRRLEYDTRYALISYGSAIKGEYGSRSHTFNGKYFTSEKHVASAIKTMGYTGVKNDLNDYNEAIMRAARQSFRPEAARVILLFNFDKYVPSWYGPTADETKFALKYEANATLFAFDNFNLQDLRSGIFSAIGVTRENVYMTPSLKITSLAKSFPRTPFTRLVYSSGGLFVNKFSKSNEKVFTAALVDATKRELRKIEGTCRKCVGNRKGFKCLLDTTAQC